MKADEFSVWFSGCSAAELRPAPGSGRRLGESGWRAWAGGRDRRSSRPAGRGTKARRRGRRPDALGTSGHERVANQGCPHCAGRAIVAWGRSHGLSRFRCGRTFNALTKTAMAHLHKRERRLDHALGDDRRQKPRRLSFAGASDDGVSLAASVSRRSGRRQAQKAERNRRGGRDLHPSESFEGRRSDLPAQGA